MKNTKTLVITVPLDAVINKLSHTENSAFSFTPEEIISDIKEAITTPDSIIIQHAKGKMSVIGETLQASTLEIIDSPVSPVKNRLTTIGYMGVKRAYLNVSREEAQRRFIESEEGTNSFSTPADLDNRTTEFEFDDEFSTYEAGR